MGTFDTYNDSPNQIKFEGQEISINFDKTSPTTGKITWNIPPSTQGCAGIEKYDGIVITLGKKASDNSNRPVNGESYIGDPTGNFDLHAGDKIGDALVVGAFYNDNKTISLDITDLEDGVPYYVSGYAVDDQKNYHFQGVHAYILENNTNFGTPDKPATQNIKLSNSIIDPNAATGLNPLQQYSFDVIINDPKRTSQVDSDFNSTTIPKYTITINGSDAPTFQDLINILNIKFAQLENPFISNNPPNTNALYWDNVNNKLFQWDGTKNIELDVYIDDTDPTILNIGAYWYDGSLLKRWDGTQWQIVSNYLSYHKLISDITCDDYWYDGTNVYNWDGQVWCKGDTTLNQITDPSLAPTLDCGSVWYNTSSLTISKLTKNCKKWIPTDVVYWSVDPTNLSIGTFWYDDNDQKFYSWNGTSWDNQTATISNVEPISPALNLFWINPDDNVIKQWDGTQWNIIQAIIYETDPTITNSCDLWWDSVNDVLYIWDITTNSWDQVTHFYQTNIDPLLPPTLEIGTFWYNSNDNTLKVWDSIEWQSIPFINYPTDPTIRVIGDIFHNTTDNTWHSWNGTNWITQDVILTTTAPNSLPTGTNWYNTTNNTLQQWNGLNWINLAYSNTSPAPLDGTLWFNTNDNLLYRWNGTKWKLETPILNAKTIDEYLQLFTGNTGSSSNLSIIPDNDNLFKFITTGVYQILPGTIGTDGVVNQPLYSQIGVGNDGNPDPRRELIDSIRFQMGYPQVEVELTKQQFDYCLDASFEELRKRTAVAYKRGFIFIDLVPGQQRYLLTNKTEGFNKIVRISNVYRQSTPYGAYTFSNAAFGQSAINQLYNLGTYDLVSYHLMSEYSELLEKLFASKILFQWNENTRALDILQNVQHTEKVLLDVSVERTEQDMINDRLLKTWIENFSYASALILLSNIRGKYGTLPGAGGVALNAADLYNQAQELMAELYSQIDDMIIETPEEFGMESGIIMG